MLFSLLALATPRIGPPPNTGPLKPEPELELGFELEDDDPDEFGFSPVSGGLSGEGLLGSTFAGGGVLAPGCCGPGVGPKTGPLFKLMSV